MKLTGHLDWARVVNQGAGLVEGGVKCKMKMNIICKKAVGEVDTEGTGFSLP